MFASRQLVDEVGRHEILPDAPHRVVCLSPSLTETVYALGLGQLVVGVTDFTDYPPEAQSKPRVGGLDDASVEKIVALHPDLVLAMGTLNREETVKQLERVGIPVYVVDPQGLPGVVASIQHVGDALNHSSDAARLLKRLEDERLALAVQLRGLPRRKVLVVIWYDPVHHRRGQIVYQRPHLGRRRPVNHRRYDAGVAGDQPGGSAAPFAGLPAAGPRRA